ncbi:glycine-rich protein [Bacillus cereus]|nr:glycine-rich protein [Bacillus cereus]
MAIYIVNQPGSEVTTFPGNLNYNDILIFNHTRYYASGRILKWSVPRSGLYSIEVWGAQGAGGGGAGARMKGDFNLQAGEILSLLVGQVGTTYSYNSKSLEGGGGGGTFVVDDKDNAPLIIAGGGGFSGGGGGGGYTGGPGGGNAALYAAGGGGSYNKGENQSNSSGVRYGQGLITVAFIGAANKPPTNPLLTKQPISNSINLSNDSVQLEWSPSTDPEGDAITYDVDFYNGTSWASIATKITTTSYDCIIPSASTDTAQLRVRATDSENGASEYTLSNVFIVAKRLYIIKDGSMSKTYKNGTWESI